MTTPMHSRIFALLLLALAATLAASAPAAAQTGTVAGRVLGEDGAPVAYALVSLRPEGRRGVARSTLSRPDGSFRFGGVAPGAYRLRLERIGVREEWSETLSVGAGQAVEWTFRGAARPVAIEGVSAGSTECFTDGRLEQSPELAAVWREAQKGIETKRVFDAEFHYRFAFTRHLYRGGLARVDSARLVAQNDPARPRPARRADYGVRSAAGYRLDVPDGTEILDPAFLRTHCLEAGVDAVDGAWEVSFRPVRRNGAHIDIQGTARVSQRTFQLESLRIEYVQGRRSIMTATVLYQDALVPGGTLRLPVAVYFAEETVPADVRLEGRLRIDEFVEFRRVERDSER